MHDVTLVDNVLQPVVRGFNLPCHVGQLKPDNRVVDQFLAERAAFVRVFDGFLIANTGEADTLNDYTNTFMIEIGHNY